MKHQHVSQLLERRIRKGDYALTGMPAERDLAGEVGVSRVTIRRALEDLQCKGFIERLPNRRVVLSAKARTAIGSLQLAVVAPSNDSFSLDIQQWVAAAESASRAAGARLRVVNYHHWDDAAISDALRSYDGVFFVTNSEPIPAWAATLLESSDRVVSLSDDLTHLGVPSIVLFPPAFIPSLLDDVRALGHREIGCFNVQGHNAVTIARIEQWRSWSRQHGCRVQQIDEPCRAGDNVFEAGLAAARRHGAAMSSEMTAIFCVTLPAAMGAVRAITESGRQIGGDVSVFTVDGEGLAQIFVPSITCFSRSDARRYMSACVDWFAAGGRREDWSGELLMRPAELQIFHGDTTKPYNLSRGTNAPRKRQ